MLKDETFLLHQTERIAQVALEKERVQISQVPPILNRFETFDRSALAFFYLNPKYIYVGVGANTVNIPATNYISSGDSEDYGDRIDSLPHNGIVGGIPRFNVEPCADC